MVDKSKHLIIITGASGTGKSTLANSLEKDMNIKPVITHTTRMPRKNEREGIDYFFETNESLLKRDLIEDVEYGKYRYGSSVEGLKKAWNENDLVSIVLDTKGAITYLDRFPYNVIVIYLKVSSLEDIRNRLEKRGDLDNKINDRINSQEFKRDLNIPQRLEKNSIVIENNDFNKTLVKSEEYIKSKI